MAKKQTRTKRNHRDHSYDLLLVNGDLYEQTFGQVMQVLQDGKQHDKIILVLVTHGGTANAAYRIARLLQVMYDEVDIFVPGLCKSAGTLLTLGANQIILTPFSELGPLDVQLLKKDELGERRSGLIIHYALLELQKQSFEMFEHFMLQVYLKSFGNVRFRTCSELATYMTTNLMSRIYEQIDVTQLGEDERNMEIAFEYGKRLTAHAQNISENNLRRLTFKYPSHDFVIDFKEAQEIFIRVELASESLYRLVIDDPKRFMVPLDEGSAVEMVTIPDDTHEGLAGQERQDGSESQNGQPTSAQARSAEAKG